VRDLLDMIYEYQRLRSREQQLDIPLDDAERVRKMGLHRLLQGEAADLQQREFARVGVPMSVQFTRPGGFESGEIRNLGGGGFMIQTKAPQPIGTQVIIRVVSPRAAMEYVFPCVVRWRSQRGPGRMGVEIDGVPSKADLYDDTSAVWRRSITLGDAPSDPMVA